MFQLGIQGAMILAGDVGDLTQKRFRKTYAGLDAGWFLLHQAQTTAKNLMMNSREMT